MWVPKSVALTRGLCLELRPCTYQRKYGHTEIPGLWTQELDAGLWTLDSGRQTLDAGIWTLESGRWTLDSEPGR